MHIGERPFMREKEGRDYTLSTAYQATLRKTAVLPGSSLLQHKSVCPTRGETK